MAAVDERLARNAPGWNWLSRDKIARSWIGMCDRPIPTLRAERPPMDRHGRWARRGMGSRSSGVRSAPRRRGAGSPVGSTSWRRWSAGDDPRTARQRRADAIGALAAGAWHWPALCGSGRLPARENSGADTGQIVIHPGGRGPERDRRRAQPGLLPGYGAVPAELMPDLASRAKLRPVAAVRNCAEPHGLTSAALADFIRCRDLTCRFPGCDCPGLAADIDHTGGACPTRFWGAHPSVEPEAAVPCSSFGQDLLRRARRLVGSAATGRPGDLDVTDRPHVHHETRWGAVLSATRHSDRGTHAAP